MKTITTQLFSFNELSEEAKQKAIQEAQNQFYFDVWESERQNSFETATELYHELEQIEEEISGSRLYAWIENNLSYYWREKKFVSKHDNGDLKICDYSHKYNCTKKRQSNILEVDNLENCPLTGVCYDYNFLSNIIEFMKQPNKNTSNLDLVRERTSYAKVNQEDYEYYTSEEYLREDLSQNEEEVYTIEGLTF